MTEDEFIEMAVRDAERAEADLADLIAYVDAEDDILQGNRYMAAAIVCFQRAVAAGHVEAQIQIDRLHTQKEAHHFFAETEASFASLAKSESVV